jgi:hypothetical protein
VWTNSFSQAWYHPEMNQVVLSDEDADDQDMKRAIGVLAVLAIVTITAAVLDEDLVLTGNGCPVGTDRWSEGADFASDDVGFATKADAVRTWFRESNLDASNVAILRAVDLAEREREDSIMVQTTEGLPAVLSVGTVNGGGWVVISADWCRVRATADHVEG